jgi:two-component system sensor histidine kinase KdpD
LPSELLLVPFDSVLTEQVLVNLLENAAKYTPAQSVIEISALRQGDHVMVSVADEGPGFPAGDEERIFDKFYRSKRPGKPSGVGLGLSICRAIVEAHGGQIWAEHQPQGGARFSFTLPLDGVPPLLVPEPNAFTTWTNCEQAK